MRVREADLWEEDDLIDHPLDDAELRQLPFEVALDDDAEDEAIALRSVHQEPELLTWRGLAALSPDRGFHLVANDRRTSRKA